MTARYVQKGESINFTPETAVAAGDLVIENDLVGVAKLDIEAGKLGAVAVVGVYEFPKGAAAAAIAFGKKVYWDATNGVVVTTATGNTLIGKAVGDAAADDATILVLLNG
jgi:predicted RecA/RadA family phage recombinase